MKIKNIILSPFQIIKTFVLTLQRFNISVAFYKSLNIVTRHFSNTKISSFVYTKLHESITSYLETILFDVIIDFKENYIRSVGDTEIPSHLWQLWWQGRESLTGITSACVNADQSNGGFDDCTLIDKKNYKKYVVIPDVILEYLKAGKISTTHFSDYLRMAILWQRGGWWLDTTCLLTAPLHKELFYLDFASPKGHTASNVFVTNDMWSTWCMGGKKNNPVSLFYCKMYEAYFCRQSYLIDYYLSDYIIYLGYKHIPSIRECIDNIPYNNPHKHDMQYYLNKQFDHSLYLQLVSDTNVFKLSRKVNYCVEKNGLTTFYGQIIESYAKC